MLETVFKACGVMPLNLIITLAAIAVLGIGIFVVYYKSKGADVSAGVKNGKNKKTNKKKAAQRDVQGSGYIPALDGLRAVCAILIFCFHDWQQTWLSAKFNIGGFVLNLEPLQRYGYIAIDAFFVMSGFCLFYPVARSMFNECRQTDWKTFYIKRARRIIPAYYFMLLVLLFVPVLSYNIYNVNDAADVTKHFGLHALFLHIYNPSTHGSVISTAWTLGIEAAFYVFFPFIAYVFKKKPVLVFAGMFVLTQLLRLNAASKPDVDMFVMVNPLLYIDIFGCGMLSAYAVVYVRHKIKITPPMAGLLTAVSVLCLAGVYMYMLWMGSARIEGMDAQSYHRLLYRWIPSWLFALFIFAAAYSVKAWQKFWGNKFFVYMSGISYSFYLWHQNIHIALKKLNIPPTTAEPVMDDKTAMVGFMLISIAASLAIATFSTYCIEKPIVKYGFTGCAKGIANKAKTIAKKLRRR